MITAWTDVRTRGTGLDPRHYADLRVEIVRTGEEMSDAQLLELADALHSLIRLRRPGRPIRGHARVADEPGAFG